MLRPLAATTAAVLLLAACGDSSSAPSAPTPLAGTVFGQPFTPADNGSALTLSEATCTIGGIAGSKTGLAIAFGSFSGLCTFATQNGICGNVNKANATVVTLSLVRANLAGATAGAVQAGTYTIGGIPSQDSQGNVTAAFASAAKTGAMPNCEPVVTADAVSGTIRIDKIDAVGARITGSADVTFPNGGHVAGTFDVPTCGLSLDVCTVALQSSCPTTPVCVQ